MASCLDRIKAVCLHMPKTGSTWRENIFKKNASNLELREVIDKHAPMAEVVLSLSNKEMFKTRDLGYRYFTFVRHPADWISSIWSDWIFPGRKENIAKHYANRGTWDNTFIAWPIANFFDPSSLDQTVKNLIQHYPDYVSYVYSSYTMGCHWVGKYETMKEDFLRILSEVDYEDNKLIESIEGEEPMNVSVKREQSISPNLRDQLYSCCQSVYNRYGYEP